jgi:cation-transporting ATPase E
MGQADDALVTGGLVAVNVVVGVVQEGRAKRTLDRIALLTRARVTVVRDGEEQQVDPGEVVLGDVLVARPGEQIVVDGRVIGEGRMEVDESLLTGEADLVPKAAGDVVYSGSFCVSGSARYVAEKVGADTYAHGLTAGARQYRAVQTPLQAQIDYVIRVLVLMVGALGVLLLIGYGLSDVPAVEALRVGAVIVALVPQGLFFMTTVAYALGAVRVAGQGALVQAANAVESLSNVTLLCLDKTGTLTTNRIRLEEARPLGDASAEDLEAALGAYARSTAEPNRTVEAIAEGCRGEARPVREAVPFSSARKWSALSYADAPGVAHILGAPEVLAPHLTERDALDRVLAEWTPRGLRVVLLARAETDTLHDPTGEPALPERLRPLGAVAFREELRPDASDTLARFGELGVQLRVISGDSPRTVSALAAEVGLPGAQAAVSGLDLDEYEGERLAAAAGGATVFGRMRPEQKQRLVGLYRSEGHYVAMLGDGVNDVLPLKQAQLGIAMESGTAATRNVADMVLLGDRFAALPAALREGQRIVRGMEDVIRLLLTRTLYVLALVVAARIVGLPFPVTPKHNSILALLTVGLPILAIAAWARPGTPSRRLLHAVGHFIFPAAFTVAVVCLGVYLLYLQRTGDLDVARSALTTVSVLCGLLLIPFVEPPTRAWVAGDELSGDWRPSALAVMMLSAYAVVLSVPGLRGFFELVPLRPVDYALLVGVVAVWALALREIWRRRLFERLVARPA